MCQWVRHCNVRSPRDGKSLITFCAHSNSLDLSKGAFTKIATVAEGEVGSKWFILISVVRNKGDFLVEWSFV